MRASLAEVVEVFSTFYMSFRFNRDDAETVWFAGQGRPTAQADARVSLSPADFWLNGTAVQTVVLAINEPIANARNAGALGTEDGALHVEIRVDVALDTFDLKWVETVPSGLGCQTRRVVSAWQY